MILSGNVIPMLIVRYLAGFASGSAVMIFHFSDNARAIETLQSNGVRLLDAEAFGILEGTG